MEKVDLIVHGAGQLCTVPGDSGPQKGEALGEVGIIENGALAVREGRIVACGPTTEIQAAYEAEKTMAAGGRCVIPGFVDPHTHIPWAGNRAGEFEQRLAGASYMEIMAAGGGIMATVRETRGASIADPARPGTARASSTGGASRTPDRSNA